MPGGRVLSLQVSITSRETFNDPSYLEPFHIVLGSGVGATWQISRELISEVGDAFGRESDTSHRSDARGYSEASGQGISAGTSINTRPCILTRLDDYVA